MPPYRATIITTKAVEPRANGVIALGVKAEIIAIAAIIAFATLILIPLVLVRIRYLLRLLVS